MREPLTALDAESSRRSSGVSMPEKSTIEGCLVRARVEWPELVRALREVLRVEAHDIGLLDIDGEARSRPPVLVQCIERASGFRLDLTFYIAASVSCPTGVELASGLARALGQEVLTSSSDAELSAPDCWILALPQGGLHAVRQLNPESDDVEIDWRPERMKKLPSPPRH